MSQKKHLSREEIAMIEIGHTESTPALNWFLTLFFLATITVVPLLQIGREFSAIRSGKESGGSLGMSVGAPSPSLGESGRSLPQSLDVCSFLLPSRAELKSLIKDDDGLLAAGSRVNNRMLRDIQDYETELKDRDVLMQWVIPRMQIPITAWLKGGNEDAYCGRDGWLFYRKDIDSLTGPGFLDPEILARRAAGGSELKAPPQPDPVKAIVDFRDQLARRGIALIVMPAPVKPSIHPERHSSRYEGGINAVQNPSFAAFVERLAAEKIARFDTAPLLVQAKAAAPGRALYLKTDTHWTPEGMELAAKALAELARQTADLPPATERFTATAKEVANLGDVATMLKFPTEWQVFTPETATVRQVLDRKQPWRPDPTAEVLLLGDSFANIFSLEVMKWGAGAGLAEHLSLALGLPVDAITQNDAGSFATREMLAKELHRGNDRLAGKKLVIWEFASRELAFGDWKLIPMALGVKRETGMYVPEAGKTVAVRGVVRAASPADHEGPYKDHIIMVHLAEMTSTEDPSAEGREAVLFVFSMRDNVQTPAVGWRPGDAISLRLRPWAEVEGEYEAIRRSELEDENLLLADPAWGE